MIVMIILLKKMKITSLIIACTIIMGIHYLLLFHLLCLLKYNRIFDVDSGVVLFQFLNKEIYCRLHDSKTSL